MHSVLILQNKLSPAYGLISMFSRVSCIKLSQEKHVIFAELSSRILCHYSSIYPHLLLGSHWVWLSLSKSPKIDIVIKAIIQQDDARYEEKAKDPDRGKAKAVPRLQFDWFKGVNQRRQFSWLECCWQKNISQLPEYEHVEVQTARKPQQEARFWRQKCSAFTKGQQNG